MCVCVRVLTRVAHITAAHRLVILHADPDTNPDNFS